MSTFKTIVASVCIFIILYFILSSLSYRLEESGGVVLSAAITILILFIWQFLAKRFGW